MKTTLALAALLLGCSALAANDQRRNEIDALDHSAMAPAHAGGAHDAENIYRAHFARRFPRAKADFLAARRLLDLSVSLRRESDAPRSEEAAARALALLESAKDSLPSRRADICYLSGLVKEMLGDADGAAACFEESLSIPGQRRPTGGTRRPSSPTRQTMRRRGRGC